MKPLHWSAQTLIAAISAMVLAALVATADPPPRAQAGLFAGLERGQGVMLTSDGSGYTILVVAGAKSYTITEVGQDYIALENPAKKVRIPIYSIKAIEIVGGR